MKKAWTALVLTVTLSLGLAAPAAAARFFDVPASYWGYSSIEYVAQRGLFSGTSQTTFSPEATMTRSMLTQVLYSYAGKPAVSGSIAGSTDYVDIPRGAYYEDAVLWALKEDIFPVWFVDDPNGAPASRFQPDRVVNRAEFSQMLFAFSQQVMEQTYQTNTEALRGYVQNSTTCQFSDMTLQALRTALPELSRYAGSSQMLYSVLDTMVGWAYARGILSGTGTSTMSPALAVTRAQVATMLAQYHRRYGEPSQPDYALKLSYLPSEMTVGDQEVLTASGQSGASYTCVSSASSVVRVTALGSGRWQLEAVGAGRATITVTDSNGKTARVTLEVQAAPGADYELKLSDLPSQLTVGDEVVLTASGQNGAGYTCTTSSSNVVRVSTLDNGKWRLYAAGAGQATITVTDSNKKTAKVTLQVQAASVPDYELKLSYLPSEMTVGDQVVLTASGQSGASYTCASSSSGVVWVTALGGGRWQLDAVGAGRATITVTDSNGKIARATVEVQKVSVPEYELKLSYLPSEMTVGDREVLAASGQSGASYTCMSSASSVVRVTALGSSRWKLDAVGAGRATITVTDSNGKTARVTVEVTQSSQVPDPGEDDVVAEVIRLVNVERAKQGLPALSTNRTINGAAQVRALELPTRFEHTRPDGRSCFTALGEAGIRYRAAGENIARGYLTPAAVVEGWMNSPGHRANILNPNFTTIGVGYYEPGRYWVQMFVG